MADISANIYDETKRYVELIMQQNVPVVDADINDSQVIAYRSLLRRLIQDVVGNGAREDGFAVEEAGIANDFNIQGGTHADGAPYRLYAEGHKCQLYADETYMNSGVTSETQPFSSALSNEVLTDAGLKRIPGSLVGRKLIPNVTDGTQYDIIANTEYTITVTGGSTMLGVAAAGDRYRVELTTPSGSNRDDLVYIDVWLREINGTIDPALVHVIEGIPFEAALRYKIIQTVVVVENYGGSIPAGYNDTQGRTHIIMPIAALHRLDGDSGITNAMIENLIPHLFRTNEIDSLYVNKTGDSMQGDLTFDAGVNITGTDVIDDPTVLVDGLITQDKLDLSTHLLGDFGVVPITPPVVHDNRYYTQSEIDDTAGRNLVTNGDFKEGFSCFNDDMPYVLDGWPLTEAMDDITVGRRLCCVGGVEINIDPCCHACEFVAFSQDIDLTCEACISEIVVFAVLSVPQILDTDPGDRLRPFVRLKFYNNGTLFLGEHTEEFPSMGETLEPVELTAKIQIPIATDNIEAQFGFYIDTLECCVSEPPDADPAGSGIRVLINEFMLRSVEPLRRTKGATGNEEPVPVIRDVTPNGLIRYEPGNKQKEIELWYGQYQKFVWDRSTGTSHGYSRLFAEETTEGKVVSGEYYIPIAGEVLGFLETVDVGAGTKSGRFNIPSGYRHVDIGRLFSPVEDWSDMIGLTFLFQNLPGGIERMDLVIYDSANERRIYTKTGIPSQDWRWVTFNSSDTPDDTPLFDLSQVQWMFIRFIGTNVSPVEGGTDALGDYRVDSIYRIDNAPPILPLPTLNTVQAIACGSEPLHTQSLVQDLVTTPDCTEVYLGQYTDTPYAPVDADIGGIIADYLSFQVKSSLIVGGPVVIEIEDIAGEKVQAVQVLASPIGPMALDTDPCVEVLVARTAFSLITGGPFTWTNQRKINFTFQNVSGFGMGAWPDAIHLDEIAWWKIGGGPTLVAVFDDMEIYGSSAFLQNVWESICLEATTLNLIDDFETYADTAAMRVSWDSDGGEDWDFCDDSNQVYLNYSNADAGLQCLEVKNSNLDVQGKSLFADFRSAPGPFDFSALGDFTMRLKSSVMDMDLQVVCWDKWGTPWEWAVKPITASSAYQTVQWVPGPNLPPPASAAFQFDEIEFLQFKISTPNPGTGTFFIDAITANGSTIIVDNFEGYSSTMEMRDIWWTGECVLTAPPPPVFDLTEPIVECTSPIIILNWLNPGIMYEPWGAVRYYGTYAYWGARYPYECMVIPGKDEYSSIDEPADIQEMSVPDIRPYLFSASPKIEVYVDALWEAFGTTWMTARVNINNVEKFNGDLAVQSVFGSSYSEMWGTDEAIGYLDGFWTFQGFDADVALQTVKLGMGLYGAADVKYGYVHVHEPPDNSCRNVFVEPVYMVDGKQGGATPSGESYQFYEHPCPCRWELTSESYAGPVWNELTYKMLADDEFDGRPDGYGENFILEYCDDVLGRIEMGSEQTPDQVKYAGGGREDPDFLTETDYITIYMGPGSSEVISGPHVREQLIALDANLSYVINHTFTVDPTGIGGFGIGQTVWIHNQTYGGGDGCLITCCDVWREAMSLSPDPNICGVYGTITGVNPGLFQVTVEFDSPVTALFQTTKLASIMVSPYSSLYYGAMGFYWEMSAGLLATISAEADSYVRWWYKYWEGEVAECDEEIQGGVIINDGDGISRSFWVPPSMQRFIDPKEWMGSDCSDSCTPSYSEVLTVDALSAASILDVCDADSWEVGEIVEVFDDDYYFGHVTSVESINSGANQITLTQPIVEPDGYFNLPAFTGFLVSRNAKIRKVTDINHACVNPTQVGDAVGEPLAVNFAYVDFETGKITFNSGLGVTPMDVTVYYKNIENTLQLPETPGVYRLTSVDECGKRSDFSMEVDVIGP